MIKSIIDAAVLALSLCADCFAVAICSSLSLKKTTAGAVLKTAVTFAVIHVCFLLCGYFLGDLVVAYVYKISHLIGFLLLLYVGGSMLVSGFKKHSEHADFNSMRKIILGGIATSIDALAVGVSLSLSENAQIWTQAISLFVITIAAVSIGIAWGKKIGEKAGSWAKVIGGIVLIAIGVCILIQ